MITVKTSRIAKSVIWGLLTICLLLPAATMIDWKTQIKNMPPGFAALASASPVSGQSITWNGTAWAAGSGSAVFLSTADFNFAAQTPGGTLTGGTPATITLSPCPRGVSGTHILASNLPHLLYISAGTGTPETPQITGGTCTGDGSTSGTIQFTPANNHSGAWTVSSDSSGIQECIYIAGASGACRIPAGSWNLYGTVTIPNGYSTSLRGVGVGVTTLLTVGTTGTWINFAYVSNGGRIDFGDLYLNDSTSTLHTAGDMVDITARISGVVSNIRIENAFNGIVCSLCNANPTFSHMQIYAKQYGIEFTGAQTQAIISDNTISGGNSAIFINGSQTVGFYVADNLLDTTNYGADTSTSAAVRFTESGINAINEVQLVNNDFESRGSGVEYNGTGGGYLNNSVIIESNRFNAQTYCLVALNQVNGLHFVGNYCTISSVNAQAGVAASDVKNLTVIGNRYSLQGSTLFMVQGSGTTSTNWIIQGNTMDTTSTATLTNAVALPNGMSNVLVSGNDFSGITTPFNGFTTCTSCIVANNNGVDSVTPTIGINAALPLTLFPNVIISGASTTITSVTGIPISRLAGTMVFSGTGNGSTAGSTIGNTCTFTQNKLYNWTFDGAKLWFNGPGC